MHEVQESHEFPTTHLKLVPNGPDVLLHYLLSLANVNKFLSVVQEHSHVSNQPVRQQQHAAPTTGPCAELTAQATTR